MSGGVGMRRSRRGGGSSSEFGSSGEDSFVAVVVTKLTGALLFILLLTMVIMALLPKAVDQDLADESRSQSLAREAQPLKIATPTRLPEAIAGRPYLVALAATGGRGPLRWSVDGTVPEWLSLDATNGQLAGTPPQETAEPLTLAIGVSDGGEKATQIAQLSILPFQAPSSAATWLKRQLRTIAWRGWLEQGIGFLVLWLVHLLGMNLLASLERGALEENVVAQGLGTAEVFVQKRFVTYRLLVRLTTLSATLGMAIWIYVTSVPSH
jgi:preprotein translocase subunit SecG